MVHVTYFYLLLTVMGLAMSAPTPQVNNDETSVLQFYNDIIYLSQLSIAEHVIRYQLSNGETRAENGYTKKVGEQRIPVISISGKYSFIGTDGVTYWVHYTADENGYHPIVGSGPEPPTDFSPSQQG